MSFIGNTGAAKTSTDPEFIRGQGWSLLETYRGGHAAVQGLADQLASEGWEFSIDLDGPYATLTARRQAQEGNDQVSLDTFTFKREHITKPIWSLQEIETEVNTVFIPYAANNTFKLYKEIINDAVDGDGPALEDTLPESTFPVAHKVALELQRGADTYEDDYTILNRKRTIGLRYNQAPLQLKNTAIIYTTSELFSEFNLPNFIHVFMPDPGPAVANAMWGWRSRVEEVVFLEGQKAEIVQDWAFAAWSTNIYTPFS